jgi:hypothetical protein
MSAGRQNVTLPVRTCFGHRLRYGEGLTRWPVERVVSQESTRAWWRQTGRIGIPSR